MRSSHALVALALLSACGGEAPPPDLSGAPVVLVVFDALAAGHVGHLGGGRPTTPNLDDLAAEGVTYTQAFAPAPYTLASISSLFTGRLPDRHGVTQGEHVLPPEEVTLAEVFAAEGYQTFGAVANIQGGTIHDLEQGFEVHDELFRSEERVMEIVPPEAFVPVLEDWLTERDPARPPFFYLHVLQPHMPYDAPAEYREDFLDPAYRGAFREGMGREWMTKFAHEGGQMHLGTGPGHIRPADGQAIQDLYDANIRRCDTQLGTIRRALEEAGLYDEALIVVTSDHGEAFWQHGYVGHSRQLYDPMMQIPLVVKLPAGAGVSGRRVDELTSLMDLFPSVCAWLDVAAPQELDGRLLPGLFGQPADPDRELYFRTFHREPSVALRSADRKVLIDRLDKQEPEQELVFDLAADPGEQAPLATPDPADLARLRAREAELLALEAGTVSTEGPSAAEQDLIEHLGYTE